MIGHLWENRERPPLFSRRYWKQWAKRIYTLPDLLVSQSKIVRLRIKGAKIQGSACLSSLRVKGTAALLEVGSHTFLGRVSMQLHAPVRIGARVCINDGVEIMTGSHDLADPEWRMYVRPVVIEDYAWVATGATILPGVTIGEGAVVGAKAVVRESVPARAVVAGNPAVFIQKMRPAGLNYDPTQFLAFQEAWLGSQKLHKR